MHIIETSLYASQRTLPELQALGAGGVKTIVEPMTYMGTPRRFVQTYLDDFERLIVAEAERCAALGIEHLTLVGAPPGDAHREQLAAHQALDMLPEVLRRPGVVGIGEVGLETCSEPEQSVLRRQLRMARELRVPIVLQAPTERKAHAVGLMLKLAQEEHVPPGQILVKGLDGETLHLVKSFGAWAGLTIHPAFLSPRRAVGLIAVHGAAGVMLQSDAGRGPGDAFAVPSTLQRLAQEGLSGERLEAIAFRHPRWFFSQGQARRQKPAQALVATR